MVGTLGLLAIIALAIYIIKSMSPVYHFIKDRLALRGEYQKIKEQSVLMKTRMDILLENGWCKKNKGFYKKGHYITNEELRGLPDKNFNKYLKDLNKC